MDRLLLTTTEVADQLGIGRTKVFDLLRDGHLASVKIGSCRRVPAAAVVDYVARLADSSPDS